MEKENGILKLEISDIGKGFDSRKQTLETVGLGLGSLLSRTEIIQGKMYLESIPGESTSYSFEIPM